MNSRRIHVADMEILIKDYVAVVVDNRDDFTGHFVNQTIFLCR